MNEPWDTQMMALGDFIRRQRKQANLSLRQLAEKTRLSNPYLSQIERGLHQPSMRVIKLISEALNVSAETLLTHAGILHSDSHGPTEGGSDGDGARSDSAQVQSDSAQVQSDSAQVQSDSAQVRSNSAQVRWDATRGQLASNDGQADTPENAMSARANVQPARVPSVELAINSEARLSDRQKAALISVYQSMLRID